MEDITSWFSHWYEQIGLTGSVPVVQTAFLYSVLAVLLALYVLVRIISSSEFPGLIQLWTRTKQLEKQSIQLATENDQLRQHILGLYDYLIQFENKQAGAAQPRPLSALLRREEVANAPDFEIVVDDYPKFRFSGKVPTIRRLSRNQLAEQAGIDLSAEHLRSSGGTATPSQAKLAAVKADGEATDTPAGKSIRSGLTKTRGEFFSKLSSLFRGKTDSVQAAIEALEEVLITSDLGVKTTDLLLARAREKFAGAKDINEPALKTFLHDAILEIVDSGVAPEILPEKRDGKPSVVLVVGVNGVGKTTTIGKLAWQFRAQGKKVLVAACDTFRAAAVEQLQVWADRSGVQVVHGAENAKPTTVAYEAIHRAQSEGYDVLLIDTAGRLHTRVNLMNELGSVVRIIEREQPGAPHETILVVDASTGQNALQQAIEFHDKAKLTGVVITKLDGTSKGGIVVAIRNELSVPIRYVGIGEGVTDLKLFSATEFTDALFAGDESVSSQVAAA